MISERHGNAKSIPLQNEQAKHKHLEPETLWAAAKGDIIGNGVYGLVELSEAGHAIKSPWPPGCEDSLRDMKLEAQIYQHMGTHPRLVKIINWDAESCVLTMEYMPHGTLKEYLEVFNTTISGLQRRLWVAQLAEGLEYLHAKDVFHYDFKPKNILVDSNLELRIADFGCSSIHNCRPTGDAGVRYAPQEKNISSTQYDIFSLGSTIYAVMTGTDPLADAPSAKVKDMFRQHQFPDLSNLEFHEIIRACWEGSYSSVSEVRRDLDRSNSMQTTPDTGFWTIV